MGPENSLDFLVLFSSPPMKANTASALLPLLLSHTWSLFILGFSAHLSYRTLNVTILQAGLNSLCFIVSQLLTRIGSWVMHSIGTQRWLAGMWLLFQLNNPWSCYATRPLATGTHSIQWHGNMKGEACEFYGYQFSEKVSPSLGPWALVKRKLFYAGAVY